jgi:hypothetical protein
MPYLIITSLYPSDKELEVVKKVSEAMSKYPPDEKLATQVVPVALKATHQGIQAIVVEEVKKGKLDEAYMYVVRRMAMLQSVKGFEYRIDPYVTAEEARKIRT